MAISSAPLHGQLSGWQRSRAPCRLLCWASIISFAFLCLSAPNPRCTPRLLLHASDVSSQGHTLRPLRCRPTSCGPSSMPRDLSILVGSTGDRKPRSQPGSKRRRGRSLTRQGWCSEQWRHDPLCALTACGRDAHAYGSGTDAAGRRAGENRAGRGGSTFATGGRPPVAPLNACRMIDRGSKAPGGAGIGLQASPPAPPASHPP